ncbi:MAG: glycoside hydrolase family 16 protein [Myxococcales bacterium]|nr:glycoside hydrolase family 16 protein [Myxococcales bacterium]
MAIHPTPTGVALALAGVLVAGGCGAPAYEEVWADEFTGAVGAAPDPASWGFDIGTGAAGWGNGELQYYRRENAALDGDGHLVITAREEDFAGQRYTSARLLTKGLREFTHGRFEARIQVPRGQGIWPAFWLLGANIDTVSWPDCGEIDAMELRGQAPDRVLGSLHGPGYAGAGAVTDTFVRPGGLGFDDDFHVFAIEWDERYVAWEVDGETYQVVTPSQLPGGAPWVFDHDFFILLNVAVGGNFVGPPDATTRFPQAMVVDYVRVTQAAR